MLRYLKVPNLQTQSTLQIFRFGGGEHIDMLVDFPNPGGELTAHVSRYTNPDAKMGSD